MYKKLYNIRGFQVSRMTWAWIIESGSVNGCILAMLIN